MCGKDRYQIDHDQRKTVRQKTRLVEQDGAGTVIALGLIAAVLGLLALLLTLSNRQIEQARLNALADNAAIAGADSLRGLTSGSPCETAGEVVLSGSANIISCSVKQTDLLIELARNGLVSRSRAGEPPF